MSKPNSWIGVVIGCAVVVASCSKTQSPAVSAGDTASASMSTATASTACEDTCMSVTNFLPDPDLVFVTDYAAAEGKSNKKGGKIADPKLPVRLFRLHMDVVLRKADPAILEKALIDNDPAAFLKELKKEPEALVKGHRGIGTLKVAIGCADATDDINEC